MDEVVKVINSKFEDKLKEMNMQSEQESRFNQQNVKHQMVMLSNRMNDVQELCSQLRNDLFQAVTELDRAGVQRDQMIKE